MLKRLAWNAYLARQIVGQKRLPFLPSETIRDLQARRVRTMIRHAHASVPFYRHEMGKLGLSPADFRALEDLEQLPVIEKEQLQQEPERFRSTAIDQTNCLTLRTGGSTGVACTISIDTAALFQNAAHGERERDLITPLLGGSFGYRETVIGSPTTTDRVVQEYCQARGWFPARLRMQRQYLSLVEPCDRNLERLNEFEPILIRSYGSYLEELFPFIQRNGAEFSRPKVITYSSDSLSPGVRRLIREEFGIPVFSFYEAVEAFKIGFECGHSPGVHQNVDLYPVRIVDERDQTVAVGETGQVIVSNLVNRATVLLNYRLGDLATRLDGRCPCGRSLPRLSLPVGRSDEYLTLPCGRRIHPQAVRSVVVEEDGVWQFQAVQETVEELRLVVVPDPVADAGELRERLERALILALGEEIRILISFADSIPRSPSTSKFRVVLSRVDQPPTRIAR